MDQVVGGNIKRERERRAWTQAQLAEAARITEKTVQRAERGEPLSAESLQSIAGAFDVAVEDLRRSAEAEEAKKVIDRYAMIPLQRIERGAELGALINGAMASRFDRADLTGDAEEDAAAEFEQELSDCLMVWEDLEPLGRRDAERALQEGIDRLRALGLAVTAGHYATRLRFGTSDLMAVTFVVATVCRAATPKLYGLWDRKAPVRF